MLFSRRVKVMRNKYLIEIVNIPDHGRCHEQYCDVVYMLRKARRAGDTEVINNTQLGALRRHNVEFKILK